MTELLIVHTQQMACSSEMNLTEKLITFTPTQYDKMLKTNQCVFTEECISENDPCNDKYVLKQSVLVRLEVHRRFECNGAGLRCSHLSVPVA